MFNGIREGSVSTEAVDNKILWLAVGFFAGMVAAVLALEYYGFIKHRVPTDAALVAEFKLLDLRLEEELKISSKDSGKIAFCSNGYLLMRPDSEKQVAAILVDDKMRGVRCQMSN